MKVAHASPFGARFDKGSGTTFRLWAPSQARVGLQIGGDARSCREMRRGEGGWHELEVADVEAGDRYGFRLADGLLVADPSSRSNPDDVHGLSEVIDPLDYDWQDDHWRGRAWNEAAIYELHLGTFTPEGTLAAAAARLAGLAELGVTAIELMPVADFPGKRNWGYDGVLLFACDSAYGRPNDLKRFVDRAHGFGIMVLLDVVYNHFGPDGNYLHAYCPEFFNARHQTPWGAAINFDGPGCATVRDFYVHNALHWVEEYRFDGLRLDAVHAIADDSPRHIVQDIAAALRDGPGRQRHVHLVLENEGNQARLLSPRGSGAEAGASAQWNDDLHHAAHALLTGEKDSYYADFAEHPARSFAKALAEGFVYQGQPSPFRGGDPHGESSAALPSTSFVSFLQNHDQIGNRAYGDRLDRLAAPDLLEAAHACLLLSPHVPMLFMGEEFAASTPFLYFCDYSGDLARAIREGRRAEFAKFPAFSDEATREHIPDPIALDTFERSKLRWSEAEAPPHAARRTLIRHLLELRRVRLQPLLGDGLACGSFSCDDGLIQVDWILGDGSQWTMRANFGERVARVTAAPRSTVAFSRGAESAADELVLGRAAVWIGRARP